MHLSGIVCQTRAYRRREEATRLLFESADLPSIGMRRDAEVRHKARDTLVDVEDPALRPDGFRGGPRQNQTGIGSIGQANRTGSHEGQGDPPVTAGPLIGGLLSIGQAALHQEAGLITQHARLLGGLPFHQERGGKPLAARSGRGGNEAQARITVD